MSKLRGEKRRSNKKLFGKRRRNREKGYFELRKTEIYRDFVRRFDKQMRRKAVQFGQL